MLLAHTAPILRNHSLKKMAKDSLTFGILLFFRNCGCFARALLVHRERFHCVREKQPGFRNPTARQERFCSGILFGVLSSLPFSFLHQGRVEMMLKRGNEW